MHDFYSAAAQVVPVLVLAIVFEARALSGSGPNVYAAFGFPVKLTAAPKWFKASYVVVLLLVPVSLFAGELAALLALSMNRPGQGSWASKSSIVRSIAALAMMK